MSKRFTDDRLWDKQWFTDLTPAEKSLWFYVKDKCDNAGVWSPAPGLVEFHIGAPVDLDAFPRKCNGNIEVLPAGKWWLVDFVEYQCGAKLNPDSKPHAAVLRLLERHGLPSRGMPRGKAYPQEKEREKELDKDKEKEEEKEYGEYVRLTDSAYRKLVDAYGENTIRTYIQRVNDYVPERKVGPYKNWAGAIRTFLNRDKVKAREKPKATVCEKCGHEYTGNYCRRPECNT